jgi:peroxiredoxin/outer membrane lipoprotein-sorting protein
MNRHDVGYRCAPDGIVRGIRQLMLLTCGMLATTSVLAQQAVTTSDGTPKTGARAVVFPDEPTAHAQYEKLVSTLKEAKSFSYVSQYRWEANGQELSHASYQMWLKKPGYARMEVFRDEEPQGTLVGDGKQFWIFWNGDRPMFGSESQEDYEKTRSKVYLRDPRPAERNSLAHMAAKMGCMSMLILQPSIFHGNMGSLEPHLDGVRSRGTEDVAGEPCDVIEVGYMKGQRSKQYWLAKSDHLPRKLKETVRVATGDIVTDEVWTEVTLNGDIADEKFVWSPPADWKQWSEPKIEDGLLKPGTPAPLFDLLGSEGNRVRLEDFRGKTVWLVFWRLGCPPCRVEFPILEQLHKQYAEQGLVVLGVNCADDKEIADQFMAECSASFPNIVDSSETAKKVVFEKYQKPGASAVPLNYLIDNEGKVLRAWYGYDKDDAALKQILESLGFK